LSWHCSPPRCCRFSGHPPWCSSRRFWGCRPPRGGRWLCGCPFCVV